MAQTATTGIVDYLKAAFKVPYNLILLAGGLLAGVVVMHPLAVWPVVGALEILYLLVVSHHPRFQNLVRSRRSAAEASTASNVAAERLTATLTPERRERFAKVRERCEELQRSAASGRGTHMLGDLIDEQQTESVNKLLWAFLRALAQEQVLAGFSTPARRMEIEESLRRVEADLAKPGVSETMKVPLGESLDVLKKRLANLDQAKDNLENLRARLLRIENSILLIQEQALTRSDPAFIENEVQAATAGLDSSEEMLRMMDLPALDTAANTPPP
ncbi:MAG TPA: hypothetical protein DD490_23595, partial [Acidobacteria bacterium]|nr:hypothetical protein [Acidobacteriota bacterium]